MDALPRIRVKKELFGQMIRSNDTNFSPSPAEDHTAKWRKSLLIRDLDLVQASIKIVVAMPLGSEHATKMGKLIHDSLKDVEGILLHNRIPIRKLDLSSPSSLPWNRRKHDVNAYSLSRPWKRTLVARNLDLVHISVRGLLFGLPHKHRSQLVDAALVTLKDLQNVILNDFTSSEQITKFIGAFKADESEKQRDETFDVSRQTQALDECEYQSELQDGMKYENMTVASKSAGLQNLQELVSPVELQNGPRSLQIQPVETQQLYVSLPLRAESGFPDHRYKRVSQTKLCEICNNRLSDESCVACRNFALKMENSMKQNVSYECSHIDDSGSPKCKVCRFNLILKFVPNYASQKVEVIHKQVWPHPRSHENSQEPVTSKKTNGNEDVGMRCRVTSPQISTASSIQLPQGHCSSSAVDILPPKIIHSPLMEQPLTDSESTIVISSVSSLAAREPANTFCPICEAITAAGHCTSCSSFALRMEAQMKKNIFYECAHENNAGSPKCRVCRYNQIFLLRTDQNQENTNKIVPWDKY